MGDLKAFAYGVLGWSETKLLNASIDYFVHTCLGWNHNHLFQLQTTNNLNKRLAYAFAETMTAKDKINIEKYFELFEKEINTQELEQINLPTTLPNGKK